MSQSSYERGLELIRAGAYFEAHEELETAWREAEPPERDFLQGLVHVAVAWYQAGRGNQVGCSRQLEKAARRLDPYAPAHRGLDVEGLLAQVGAAAARAGTGDLLLDPVQPDRLEHAVQGDLEPPVAPEEEQ
jgi:predicted metal-dependent hydrolase